MEHVARNTKLARILREFFALGVINNPGVVNAGLTFTGAIPDVGSQIAALNLLNINGASDNVTPGGSFSTSAAATITISSFGGLIQRLTNGGAVTVTFDAAYNIVNNLNIPQNAAYLGQTFLFNITTNAATTVATPTLLATDVTLSGTTTVLAAAMRWYRGAVTQIVTVTGAPMTAGTTFTSLTQVGTSNLFTVALGTNALVPVVGTAILLTGITGTLPPGWYPIVTVSSATSFVIATPIGTVWTATAATVPGTTVVPASAYSPGYTTGTAGTTAGLYAPLVTITGMMATVTGTMSV